MHEEEKIQFVTSVNGTSCGEILAVLTSASLLPFVSILLLPWLVPSSFSVRSKPDVLTFLFVRLLIEFPVIAVLTGVVLTFLTAELSGLNLSSGVTATVIFTALLILTIDHTVTRPRWSSLAEEWSRLKRRNMGWSGPGGPWYPFITNFRGMITYLTVFTILAVDFPIFPRRFAKTKTYGMSLMDIGTASFIFANGIVAPEAKNRRASLRKSLVSSIPLLVLGFVRLLAIKGTEYHEVVEEYGVHWNFFFTLATVKVLGGIIFTFLKPQSALAASIAVGAIYEAYLCISNVLDDYILNPAVPRDHLLDANREGVYSTLGYLSIYLASVYLGHMLYAKERHTVGDWIGFLRDIAPLLSFLWTGYYVTHNHWSPVCRRAANLSYTLWSLSVNLTVLCIHLFLCILLFAAQAMGILHGPMIAYQLHAKNMKGEGKHFEAPAKGDIPKPKLTEEQDDSLDKELEDLEKKVDELQNLEKSNVDVDRLEKNLKTIGEKLIEREKMQEAVIDSIDRISCLPNLVGECLFYRAVCYNGLVVFLMGNLLTGLVNLLVRTEIATATASSAYLLEYVTIIYVATFALYSFDVQLKFW